MELTRHAPLGRVRPRFATATLRSRPHAYAGRPGGLRGEIFASDHAEGRRTGRFRWVLSTCLAAAVGALAILVAVAGSMDSQDNDFAGLQDRLRQASLALRLPTGRGEGLHWALPRTDKMLLPKGAVAQKFFIPEPVKQKRGQREYTFNKYYVRLVAGFGPISKTAAAEVPQFNPFKLYANTGPVGGGDRSDTPQEAVPTKLIELNGILTAEDGQELDAQEVEALVQRAQAAEAETAASGADLLTGRPDGLGDAPAPQTTLLSKTVFDSDSNDEDATRELAPIKVQRGDTLQRLLPRIGAQAWQVTPIMEAIRAVLPDIALQPGYEVHAIVLPVPPRPIGELVRFSVLDGDGEHKVTVTRVGTKLYKASATPVDERLPHVALADSGQGQSTNSLYASFYHLATRHGIPEDLILQVLRIHAPLTDFRQRVRAGDGIELFFDLKGEDRGVDGELGDLLATFITTGGETRKYYRFRSSDGVVDFYDADGDTARKFLMRLPVRARDVRLTSGYGLRMHPLLRIAKMHAGEDWACAYGTPIMAVGSGVIVEAGPKGENGNYIRILHANGYETGYGHMSRFAPGVAVGVRVRQGQVIGYVGSTGLSSGPHVHFELWVKNQNDNGYHHVNPGTMPAGNERQLKDKDLADFKRERARIDDLMRRHPVRSAQLQ